MPNVMEIVEIENRTLLIENSRLSSTFLWSMEVKRIDLCEKIDDEIR